MPALSDYRGSARARRAVIDHLRQPAHLPARVNAMRTAGLDVVGIADGEWHSAWKRPQKCTNLPAICAAGRSSRDLGRVDWVDGNPQHLWAHTMRLYLWARGAGEEQVADRIELLLNAVVTELLARPGLGDGSDGAVVEEPGLTVGISPVGEDTDGASIAGAYIEFVVSMTETADIPALGSVQGQDDSGQIDLIVEPEVPA